MVKRMNNDLIKNSAVKIIVSGDVQGVGFRYYIARIASGLELKGYVKNLFNGDVEIYAEGEREYLEELAKKAKLGPSHSFVTDFRIEWWESIPSGGDTMPSGLDFKKKYNNFEIK
jgi:acylphosphatase